jgi:hypothetical protein
MWLCGPLLGVWADVGASPGDGEDQSFIAEDLDRSQDRVTAVGRSLLVIIWHPLSDPQARYHDLGPDFYDTHISNSRKMRNHVRQLQALGYKVTLEPAA